MLQQVHQHIVSELGQGARTDTIFVVTAILFNLIVLGINSGVSAAASAQRALSTSDLVFIVFVMMTIVINAIALVALFLGRRTRQKLLAGLVLMYQDNDVDKYYDPSLLSTYGVRYILFAGIMGSLGLTSILVPLIIRFL